MKDISNIFKIGISDIIGSSITALFWFYLASQITPSDFGDLNYFISIAGITSYFILIGTQNTITVFTAKKIPVQSTLGFISIIGSIISFFITFIIFNRVDIGFLIFGYVLQNFTIGLILGNKKYKNYSIFLTIQKSLSAILAIGFFFMFGFEYIILGFAISYIVYIFEIIKNFNQMKINFHLFLEKKSFIINNYLISLSGTIQGQIDKLIIMPLLGSTLLGNYSLSLQIISIMMIGSSVLFKYLVPQESSGDDVRQVKKFLIFLGVVLTFIGFFIVPEILPSILPEYVESINAIRIMSLSLLPMSITTMFHSKFLSIEKSQIVLIGNMTSSIVLISTMIILGLWYGILGIATSFVLSTWTLVLYYYLVKKLNLYKIN